MQPLRQSNKEPVAEKLNAIYAEIENFSLAYGRLPLSSDLKEFYHSMHLKSPFIAELAYVVPALPATQMSVETPFSALNFVLNERRSSLKAENINSLLVVKLNS